MASGSVVTTTIIKPLENLDNIDDGVYRILVVQSVVKVYRLPLFSVDKRKKHVVSPEKASPSASALCVFVCMVGPPRSDLRYTFASIRMTSHGAAILLAGALLMKKKKHIRKEASSAQYDLNKISEYLNREFVWMVCAVCGRDDSDFFHPLVG